MKPDGEAPGEHPGVAASHEEASSHQSERLHEVFTALRLNLCFIFLNSVISVVQDGEGEDCTVTNTKGFISTSLFFTAHLPPSHLCSVRTAASEVTTQLSLAIHLRW